MLKKILNNMFRRIKVRTWVAIAVFVVLIPLVIIGLYHPSESKAEWFNDAFAFRQPWSFTHNAALSDRRISFTISNTNTLVTAGKLQSDCDDVRFTDASGKLLQIQLTGTCNSASTTYDVIIPTVVSGLNAGFVYYGNPGASSASADISAFTTLSPSGGAPAFTTEEKTTGPVSYWPLDEGTDNTCPGGVDDICDVTSNNYSGTRTGALFTTEDRCNSGKCLEFDGTDDTINIGNETLLNFERTNAFSVGLWIRTGAAAASMTLVSKQESSGNFRGWNIQTGSNGSIYLQLANVYSSNTLEVRTTNDMGYNNNQWHHVLVTYSGNSSSTGVKIYFDGKNQPLTVVVETPLSATIQSGTANVHLGSRDGGGQFYNGFMDDVKVYNYVRTAAQVKTDFASENSNRGVSAKFGQADNAFLNEGLVGYWPTDESTANTCGASNDNCDKSGNGFDGAWNGDATTASGKFGSSVTLDGTGDYVNIPDTATLNITGDITVSTWIFMTSLPGAFTEAVMKSQGITTADRQYGMGLNSSNKLRGLLYVGGVEFVLDGNTTATTNTWTQLVLTRKDDRAFFYINGSQTAAATVSGALQTSTGSLKIGALTSGAEFFNGKIDDTRVYNRALTAAEVRNLYNWAPGPVGYWKMDENTGSSAFDSSTNGNTGTLTSGPTWTNGKFGNAMNFDLVGDNELNFASPAVLDDLPALTASAWIYPRSDGESHFGRVFDKTSGTAPDNGWELAMNDSVAGGMLFASDWTGTNVARITDANRITNNTWQYVTVTWDGSLTGTNVHLYVNGVETGYSSTTNGGSPKLSDASSTMRIGNSSTLTRNFDGYIDEAKIYSYVRTQQQIIEDMNGGHPTGGSPVGSQAVYWTLNEAHAPTAYDQSGPTFSNGTSTSADFIPKGRPFPSITNGSCKIEGCALFDVAGDVIAIPTASDSEVDFVNTEKFSLASWIYIDDMPGNTTDKDFVIGKWDNASLQRAYRLYLENDDTDATGNLHAQVWDESADQSLDATMANDTILEDTWYHVVMTFNGTATGAADSVKMYVDGRQRATSSSNGSFASLDDVTADFTIGDYDVTDNTAANTTIDGLMDEVQVYSDELTPNQIKIVMNAGSSISFGNGTTGEDTGNAPVGFWTFNEGIDDSCTGGTNDACDSSGYNFNHDGVKNSMSTANWVSGKVGRTLLWDGSNDEVIVTDPADGSLDFGATSFTMSAWAKTSTTTNNPRIISKGFSAASNGYRIQMISGGTVAIGIGGGGVQANALEYTTVDTFNDSAWHYYEAVIDTATTRAYIYVDGKQRTMTENGCGSVTSDSLALNFSGCVSFSASNALNLSFGANLGGTEVITGSVDEVKIYNYARNAAQVAYDYNRGTPIAWWRFDECSGTVANDGASAANTNVGTVVIGGGGFNSAPGSCSVADNTSWYIGKTGKQNTAVDLDGTDDWVDMNDVLDFADNQDFSISLWVNRQTFTTDDTLVGKRNGQASGDIGYIAWIDDATDDVNFEVSDGTDEFSINGTTAITAAGWHHIVIVFDEDNATNSTIYVDGILDKESTAGTIGNVNDLSSAVDFRVGSEADNGELSYGTFDNVQVFNYVLAAAQVKKLYNDNASARFGPNTGAP